MGKNLGQPAGANGRSRSGRETTFALDVDELDQLFKGHGGNLFDGGKLLDYRPAGCAKQVGERLLVLPGVLAGLQIQDGRAISLLPGQVVNHVVAIAGQKAQRQIGFVVLEWRAEISRPQRSRSAITESIDRIGLVHIYVALLEVGG